MPVVTVTAAPDDRAGALLIAVADGVAAALDLGPGDVIATLVPSSLSATSGSGSAASVSRWPLVSIHGSDRGSEKMEAARDAAESAVRAWSNENGVECEGVWTQWLTPLPR
jgi:hypothetical protein